MEPAAFAIGQRVVDRDDDDPNTALVVNTPPIPANDWEVYGGPTTVADDNPDYPEDAPIVIVVFEEDLPTDTDWDYTTYVPIVDLTDLDTTIYTFPAPRLTPFDSDTDTAREQATATSPIDDGTHPTDDGDTTADTTPAAETAASTRDPALTALEDQLAQYNLDITPADDGQALLIDKLGITYRVSPDGVEGDGPHRKQLQQFLSG